MGVYVLLPYRRKDHHPICYMNVELDVQPGNAPERHPNNITRISFCHPLRDLTLLLPTAKQKSPPTPQPQPSTAQSPSRSLPHRDTPRKP